MRSLASGYTAALKQDVFSPRTLWRAWESAALPAMLEALGLQGVQCCSGVVMGMRNRLWRPIAHLCLLCTVRLFLLVPVPLHELGVAAGKGNLLISVVV